MRDLPATTRYGTVWTAGKERQAIIRRVAARRVVRIESAGGRADVLATLTAVLPWQRRRGGRPGGALVVRPEGLRGRTRRLPGGRLLIIVVDASGSMGNT